MKNVAIGGLGALVLTLAPGYERDNNSGHEYLKHLNTGTQQEQVLETDYKESALEKITGALAPNKAYAADSNNGYQIPSDEVLKEWMDQPVEKTLAGTDYTPVNDRNYEREVFQSHLPESERQPAMVLFYGAEAGSRGLGVLTTILAKQFEEEIKVFTYKIDDQKSMSVTDFQNLAENYPLKTAPALLVYEKTDNGEIKYFDSIQGGIKSFELLKNNIPLASQHVGNYLFK